MESLSCPTATVRSSLDLLEVLRGCGLIPARRLEEIADRVRRGTYSSDAPALAARLIKKELLTPYQARRLLHGQAENLIVGRYIILDRLGRGSMGKVYKARHRLMGRVVALKFIAREYLTRRNAVPRFLREMRLVGRLDHPHIVRALDAEEIGRDPCIVMEYVPGQDLERLLNARRPFSPEEVARYALQAALGLAHAHEQGVIHRDIKPSNLLLGEDGRIRLLDLGLATLMDDADADKDTVATCDGMAVGTADYMSPEQAVGQQDLDGRSDLYSLGCVMYHLLTGQVPFPEESRIECLARRIKGRPAPLATLRPGLPPALVEVVDRLLANRRDDRYATAAETAEALRGLAGGEPSPPGHAAGPTSIGVTPMIGGSGSISVVTPSPAPAGGWSSASVSDAPLAPPGWWLRTLTRLSEWSPWAVLLAGSAALLASFVAGILISPAIR